MRQIVLMMVRAAGVVFCIVAAFSLARVVTQIVYTIRLSNGGFEWYYLVDAEVPTWAMCFVAQAGLGFGLCRWSGRLAAWLVPSMRDACLRCGHRMDAANVGVCPECGTAG